MTPPERTAPRLIVSAPAAGIAVALGAHGLAGPVLVVADDAAIAAWAPAWAASFAAAGVTHRVVVAGVDAAAAAAGLGARVVMAAGAAATGPAARAAAALDLPLVEAALPT